ncbi:MAG: YezD family protein [Verrucomicrobiota bacterium]
MKVSQTSSNALPTSFLLKETEVEWVQALVEKVRSLRYGTVHVKVHEAQVVLIETTEQTRFDLQPKLKR